MMCLYEKKVLETCSASGASHPTAAQRQQDIPWNLGVHKHAPTV